MSANNKRLKKVTGYAMYALVTKPGIKNQKGDKSDPLNQAFMINLLPENKEQEGILLAEGLRPTRFDVDNKDQTIAGTIKKASTVKGMEHIKTDGTDCYFVFKRPVAVVSKKSGETVLLPAPVVVDAQGNTTDVLIGNGSLVTLAIEIYENSFGKTVSQLAGVQVLNLVEYKPSLFSTDVRGTFTNTTTLSEDGTLSEDDNNILGG